MKIILSRKGFDSTNGGCASPIFCASDTGKYCEMLSLPIPDDKNGNVLYSELKWKNIRLDNFINKIKKRHREFSFSKCHLDPDLRKDIRIKQIEGWKPAFGQANGALTILEKNSVSTGDIFLFYGWFRKVSWNGECWMYVKNAPDIHVIYGFLQIGNIEESCKVINYPWHPHCGNTGHDAMFFPSEKLIIDNKEILNKGYGTFYYSEELCLTKNACPRSHWKELPFFKKQWQHYKKGNYYQSPCIGQEFVFDINDNESINWVKNIFKYSKQQ